MDRRTQTEARIGAYTCINSCSDLLLAELEMDDTLRSASLPALPLGRIKRDPSICLFPLDLSYFDRINVRARKIVLNNSGMLLESE